MATDSEFQARDPFLTSAHHLSIPASTIATPLGSLSILPGRGAGGLEPDPRRLEASTARKISPQREATTASVAARIVQSR